MPPMSPMSPSPRTESSQRRYEAHKLSGDTHLLAEIEPIKDFTHWRIIPNEFPYDMIWFVHHMLLPKRKVGDRSELAQAEAAELQQILDGYVEHNYDAIIDNTRRVRSVTSHYHLHLGVYYGDREDMKL